MVSLTKIYTRTGDNGETGIGDGSRVSKLHERIIAGGSVDETNSLLGMAAACCPESSELPLLHTLQQLLFDVGADISVPWDPTAKKDHCPRMTVAHVEWIEQQIDACNANLSALKSFVLPGGNRYAASLHVARSVCRRAEVDVLRLLSTTGINPQIPVVLNRLSDLLFVLARTANDNGKSDVLWEPGRAISTGSGT